MCEVTTETGISFLILEIQHNFRQHSAQNI